MTCRSEEGRRGSGGWGAGAGTTRLIVPPPSSTQVFICTSPLMKYDHCVQEKVRLPQRSMGNLSFLNYDFLKETIGGLH